MFNAESAKFNFEANIQDFLSPFSQQLRRKFIVFKENLHHQK
jgi:hypothetical protein